MMYDLTGHCHHSPASKQNVTVCQAKPWQAGGDSPMLKDFKKILLAPLAP